MEKIIKTSILPDEDGFIGRECPTCGVYFKVMFGTGLPIDYHLCPYCGHKGNVNEFHTKDQISFATSKIISQELNPIFNKFKKNLKSLESSSINSPIQIRVKVSSGDLFKIKNYQEKILETKIICDNCGLNFSIYGVFSNCPDCGKLNANKIFEKSIEASKKKLDLSEDPDIDEIFKEELLKDSLTGSVSAFDSFGKALRSKHTTRFPSSPKNLFQNFSALDNALMSSFRKNIKDYLSQQDSDFLFKMFQVRHIYEHNSGVIDDDFIRNLHQFSTNKGRKYPLTKPELDEFLDKLSKLMKKIYLELE